MLPLLSQPWWDTGVCSPSAGQSQPSSNIDFSHGCIFHLLALLQNFARRLKMPRVLVMDAGRSRHWDFMVTSLRPRARASCRVLVYSNHMMLGIRVVSLIRSSSDIFLNKWFNVRFLRRTKLICWRLTKWQWWETVGRGPNVLKQTKIMQMPFPLLCLQGPASRSGSSNKLCKAKKN